MKKVIIILLLILSSSVFAQNKDSLLSIIKAYKLQDTLQCYRLNSLIELENDETIWMNYNEKMGSIASKKLISKPNDLYNKIYSKYYGLYFNNLGYYFMTNENYEKSLANYFKSVKILANSNNIRELALVYQNIGIYYNNKGEPKMVLKYFNSALDIYKKIKDSTGLANVYTDIGGVYTDNGADTKAFVYYTKSMKISDLTKNESSKIRTILYTLQSLLNQKEYYKALDYLSILEKYNLKIDDKNALQGVYNNEAFLYNELNDSKNMFIYSNKSIELAKKIKDSVKIANSYGILSRYYLKINNINDALKYTLLELKIREHKHSEPNNTINLIQYSHLLNLKSQFKMALNIGKIAYNRAEKLNYIEHFADATKNLKEVYKNIGNKTMALKYAEIELKIKDSIRTLNSKNSAIKALFNYEAEKKEDELTKINQEKKITELENERQRAILIFGIISVFLATLISFLLFKRYKNKKKTQLLKLQLEETQKTLIAEKKAAESELKALKSQMNPHFIFNALNSIQEQFMYGDKLVANEQMGNFTTLTREILNVSGKKKITIQKEIDILTKYLDLEKMRFDKDFSYKFIINEGIDEHYDEIPPMILQPFVENSIKHGLLHQMGQKTLSITFDVDANRENILCTIIDNGIGRQKSEDIKTKNCHVSFSTSATEQRLDILNNNKSDQKLIVYEDINDPNGNCIGTKVMLTIPIV